MYYFGRKFVYYINILYIWRGNEILYGGVYSYFFMQIEGGLNI